jgi:hypothetical protein
MVRPMCPACPMFCPRARTRARGGNARFALRCTVRMVAKSSPSFFRNGRGSRGTWGTWGTLNNHGRNHAPQLHFLLRESWASRGTASNTAHVQHLRLRAKYVPWYAFVSHPGEDAREGVGRGVRRWLKFGTVPFAADGKCEHVCHFRLSARPGGNLPPGRTASFGKVFRKLSEASGSRPQRGVLRKEGHQKKWRGSFPPPPRHADAQQPGKPLAARCENRPDCLTET